MWYKTAKQGSVWSRIGPDAEAQFDELIKQATKKNIITGKQYVDINLFDALFRKSNFNFRQFIPIHVPCTVLSFRTVKPHTEYHGTSPVYPMVDPCGSVDLCITSPWNLSEFRLIYPQWYFKEFRIKVHGGTLNECRIIVHGTLSQWPRGFQLVTHGTLSEFRITYFA